MTSFVTIIISVNFQLKQLSAKFLPLTISYSCCSIPISSLVKLADRALIVIRTYPYHYITYPRHYDTHRSYFICAYIAMLSYVLDSNVTKLLANLLTKPSVFYYFANCIVYSCFNKNYYCFDYY